MASKKARNSSEKVVVETLSEVAEASHPDGVAGALDSLLAAEASWRKTTIADVVEAHMSTILLLLEKRCPIEKIVAAMISGGVKASPATLSRIIQGVKNGAKAAPKKAPKKAAPKAKPAPVVPPSDNSDKSDEVPTESGDGAENGSGEVPPNGEHNSIGNVAEFLQAELTV